MEYYVTVKKNETAVFSNMDEPRDYHTKFSKSYRERQITYGIAFMWNLKKMIQINLLTKWK